MSETSHLDVSRKPGATATPPSSPRTQVLALSGGGYRGLYTAHFLANAERHFDGVNAASRFNLVIGTSIGGLIATALALEVPASTVVAKIVEHGPRIFSGSRGGIAQAKRHAWSAPYKAAPLRAAIVDTLGASNARLKMSDVARPLAICAVNFTHGRPEVFRSKGLARRHASHTTVIDAVMASTAAPTYFPAHQIGVDMFIDGGIIANAPEVQGITEAQSHLGKGLANLYVLSIGTAARRKGAPLTTIGAASTREWMLTHDLFDGTLAAQVELARAQATAILGNGYYLVDREPLEKQVAAISGLDVVTEESTKTLLSLADESWLEHRSKPRLRRFFDA